MNKFLTSILFGAGFLLSACTVHHYHHQASAHGAKRGHHGHRGAKGQCGAKRQCSAKGHQCLPEDHPSVEGHGLPEGHPSVEGHSMPEGHPSVKGHHRKKGQHGMKSHHGEAKGHQCSGHGAGGDHEKLHANLPAPVAAFHESFAPVWHEKSDATRSTGACAKAREWETLAKGVSEHKAQRDQAVAYAAASKSLAANLKVVTVACRQKKASVQEELTSAHNALHNVLKSLAK
ncbi:MAG: hypothetical protein GY811_21315 [Myxococcales bacterium]|nr:hypothetical protein [Myxococcales bacterium]